MPAVSFRAKISIVILLAVLLPTLAIVGFSAYILNSTLNKVGASGLESSLSTASDLVEKTQAACGDFLKSKLPSIPRKPTADSLRLWANTNSLDLVYVIAEGKISWYLSDSLNTNRNELAEALPRRNGLTHVEVEDLFFLVYSQEASGTLFGCGRLFPQGYARDGRSLAQAVSAAASLAIYKAFSIKLLAIITLCVAAFSVVAGIIFSTAVSRQLAKPLGVLAEGAAAIGKGDLDHKVIIGGNDEFAQLAESFNTMAHQIKENQLRLLETERLAAWREVARRIAHEIRNPITPISIELFRLEQSMAKLPGEAGDDCLKSIEVVKSQIQILQELAQQFSTFAKEPELRLAKCSLKEIIHNSVGLYKSMSGISIACEIPDDIPIMQIDSQMMSRVFMNLIKNSIEASPQHAMIRITASHDADSAKVVVRDSGPGFPNEKLEKIEQPYITSKKTGSGLGLAIVKKIIEEHGGKIRFYNDGGAVAEIVLPFKH